ncbi:MAG: glycosyltransferase family 4 protein [Patescibacteria group bacterium]
MISDRPRVAILTDYLLHPEHDTFLPTSENLSLLELCRLIREDMGWEADVYQISPHPERIFGRLRVVGINAAHDRNGMFPELNFAFARAGLFYDLRIYHHWHLAFPQVCHCSIVVSQGVFWDSPSGVTNRTNPVGREEWSKRLLYAVAAPSAFVVQDRNTANVIKATWPGYEHRLHYLPPGVDLEAFHPPAPRPEEGGIRVICPQDFGLEQGLNEILTLCGLLREAAPGIELHIVGRMREFTSAAALAARVRSLPNSRFYWVPAAMLPSLYRAFDLALLPYRASVGVSLHCLRAMATGLPVVAGLAGGLAEMVVDGWNGRLVQPGSAGILLEAVLGLAKDGELRRGMGANARRLAEGYPASAWRARWRELLTRVLSAGDPGVP